MTTTEQIIIDDRALSLIKDIAHKMFMEHVRPGFDANRLLLTALHDFLLIKGIKPNFKVKQ